MMSEATSKRPRPSGIFRFQCKKCKKRLRHEICTECDPKAKIKRIEPEANIRQTKKKYVGDGEG